MKYTILATIIFALSFTACNTPQTSTSPQNKAGKIVQKMLKKTGDYQQLADKKDVVYTYTYQTPDGKKDVSTEKYIFDEELSYGAYQQHERTLPDLQGLIEQGYDGNEFWLKHKGKVIKDEKALKRVAFSRPTNFYWFAMFQKLLDPGLIYEHLGEEKRDGITYDIVKISFQSQGDKATDIYQLYVNQKTALPDFFLFTVADFGVMDEPLLMQLEYEEVEGLLIPTKRKYKKSTWDAKVTDAPWINVNWSDIKFNNNLRKEEFLKTHTMKVSAAPSAPLKSMLDEKKNSFALRASDNKKRAYREGIEAVANSGILDKALQVGDTAPNFTLNNALGKPVSLNDYLQKGDVVLTWYRGGWCPYCNLTLHQLQLELPNFKANGANLIALTPELPDKSISTAEKNDLKFEVLSDIGNKTAHDYGIVFQLTDEVAEMYNAAFDMNGYNGDQSNELPLAATYIINQAGKITYAFLDADYRNRAEPAELTAFLQQK